MNPDLGELSAEEVQAIQEMRRKRQQQLVVTKVKFPEIAIPSFEEISAIAVQYDRNITGLRSGQYECIADLLQQNNVFAIIPTGGGKSLIWLLPAIIIQRSRMGKFVQLMLMTRISN